MATLAGPGSQFDRVVGIVERFWRADRTTSITRIALACTLREFLPDHVPVARGGEPGSPAVVVNASIGVVVADDGTAGSLRRRIAAAADRVEKVVVYVTTRAVEAIDGRPGLSPADADLADLSVVNGGVRADRDVGPAVTRASDV